MMRRGRIAPRRRVFVGCEGESERGYAALIASLLDERHQRFHLDLVPLGGGDPLAIVETAERQIRQRVERRGSYAARFVLLDADKGDENPVRRDQAIGLAKKLNIRLIWQDPCHEALLLRHLPACEQKRPGSTAAAMQALRGHWPQYEKPMARVRLGERIDRDSVLRAQRVELELRDLLLVIEFDK